MEFLEHLVRHPVARAGAGGAGGAPRRPARAERRASNGCGWARWRAMRSPSSPARGSTSTRCGGCTARAAAIPFYACALADAAPPRPARAGAAQRGAVPRCGAGAGARSGDGRARLAPGRRAPRARGRGGPRGRLPPSGRRGGGRAPVVRRRCAGSTRRCAPASWSRTARPAACASGTRSSAARRTSPRRRRGGGACTRASRPRLRGRGAWAHHVARSAAPGDREAIAALVEAAHAVRLTAPGSAAQWLQAALALQRDPSTAERLEILVPLGDGAHRGGRARREPARPP